MEKKKKSIWFNVLIYVSIIAVFALLFYVIIDRSTQKFKSISADDGINLIVNKADEYEIKNFSVEINGGEATAYMEVKNDVANTTAYYTFSMYAGPFADPEGWSIYSKVVGYTTEQVKTPIYETDTSGNVIKYNLLQLIFEDTGKMVSPSQYHESAFLAWLPTIISTVVTIIIFIFFFRLLMSTAGGNQKAMDFNKSRAKRSDDSKVRFKDVAGCDEEKAEMIEIVDYLKDPKKFTKYGAKLPKGILLVGPPGTGKTLLAKAVAGEAGVPFYSISGSDFVEMFVGVGAGRVRDLFKTAKQNAPCLIFIDEIDAVGRQRGAGLGGGNDEREQTLNQLLVELDGFEENSGIIVIAATNRDDVLDPALLRAGRFDRQITVNLPDREGREAIFKVHSKNKKLDPSIDFKQLAKRTVGFSGADIANIINEAAILAVRAKHDEITMADIDEAIDRRIAGPAKSSKGMNEKERRQVAYHEAGHAIIGLSLKNSDKVRKITIIPRGRTGGHVLMGPEDDRFLLTKSELEARIVGYLGGRSSEEIFFQDVSTGASNDIEVATSIARSMVVEYGMSSLGPIQYEKNTGSVFLGRDYTNAQKNFSVAVADEIDKEIRKIIEDAHNQALQIISDRRDDVTLIAETLLEYETINEEQINYLLENRKMPEGTTQKDSALSSINTLKESENKDAEVEKTEENPAKVD
ncbi:MAG: ATP-dependent zinc metalloprotease FtsH [Candidatus Onthovivens sp.]|nr:ATP-dependent zinc metalloprotease FtsH [Candidatus Onthovivens sp.]